MYELLIGSAAFWDRARSDIAAARQRVLVQAMTFEGDSAGQGLAAALTANHAVSRRVLVDDYTSHVINDTMLVLSRDPAVHAEARATQAMFGALVRDGVQVRVTNPVGHNPLRYPMRNHKKLLVMDSVAWIGGINFSDHNFAWHDLMLRIDDPAVADWLAEQFDGDWTGTPEAARQCFGSDLELLSIDGRDNLVHLAPLLDRIAGARHSIEMISAYATFPFVDALAAAAQRGVAATLYTPRPNNKPIVRDYLLGVARETGLRLRLMPEMTHAKALLIDGEELVLGSCNFEFVSCRSNAEFLATIRDAALIADFEARMLAPARIGSADPVAADFSLWRSRRARAGLKLADAALARLSHGTRVQDWG